jgi:hypothetical protein
LRGLSSGSQDKKSDFADTSCMAQCWTSGGPFWLFGLTLYAGFMVPVAAVWWFLAWSERPARKAAQPRSKALLGALPGLLLVAYVLLSWQGPPPSALDIAGWVGVAVLTVGVVAVHRQRVTAVASGVELSRGWRRAAITTRWGAPAATIALVLASVGAFTTYLAMGHPIPC